MENYIMLDGRKFKIDEKNSMLLRAVVDKEKTEKKTSFERMYDEEYYFIKSDGGVEVETESNSFCDDEHHKVANYCADRELMCQRALHETLNRLLWRYREVCYVTRTYLTRHGAGAFDSECDKSEINGSMEDKTNVPNPYQGSIRYGKLDVNKLVSRIKKDIGEHSYNVSLAVTHLNEFENKELLTLKELNVKYLSYKETRELAEKNF